METILVIPAFLFVFLVSSILLSMRVNRDLFSPVKFYYLYLSFFFLGIFIYPQINAVYLYYVFYLVFGLGLIYWEKKIILDSIKNNEEAGVTSSNEFVISYSNKLIKSEYLMHALMWGITLIPLLAFCVILYISGGVDGYFKTFFHERVVSRQGYGYLFVWLSVFPVISLAYFMLGLFFKVEKKFIWWSLVAMHVALTFVFGLMLGSRGATVSVFLLMLIAAHYLWRNIKTSIVIVFAVILILSALFLGSLRNALVFGASGGISLKETYTASLNKSEFNIGIEPLQVLYLNEFTDLHHGKTLFSVFTHFVPRGIWPSKPDSGGTVITQFKDGDRYTGYSHITTGLIAEGIINFGYYWGPIVGFVLLSLVAVFIMKLYQFLLKSRNNSPPKYKIFSMIYVYITCANVLGYSLIGEFTHIYMNLIIKIVFFLFIVAVLYFCGIFGKEDSSSEHGYINKRLYT